MKKSLPLRSTYELQQLSGWWLDLSKIFAGSFVVKFFETSRPPVSPVTTFLFLAALLFSAFCAKVGLQVARKVSL